MNRITDSVEFQRKFWARIDIRGRGNCWLWLASTNNGYGRFWIDNQHMAYAHRIAYELVVGPIPSGMDLDHVKARGCRSRACCNPAHLEIVTRRENLIRGNHPNMIAARENRCRKGHPFAGSNVRYYMPKRPGAVIVRYCRACARLWHKNRVL